MSNNDSTKYHWVFNDLAETPQHEIWPDLKANRPPVHSLNTLPDYFEPARTGIKRFEIRKHDRDFAVGDVLWLREYDPATDRYTGRELNKTISYMTNFEQQAGFVVLGWEE